MLSLTTLKCEIFNFEHIANTARQCPLNPLEVSQSRNWLPPGASEEMSRLDISVFLVLTLISTSARVCNSQLNELELWRVGMIVGIGSLDNLFQFTDQPVIFSPNKQYYLAVQAVPANPGNNPGNEFFCWMSVVNQSLPANKTNVWRAPCDQELQRSNDSMQLCYFGISTDGNLLLSHAFSNGAIAFSSNTTGLGVDHAILNNSGSILLQTAANVTVWTSASHQAPNGCIGPLPVVRTVRPPIASPPGPSPNVTGLAPPPSKNSGDMIGREASRMLATAGAVIFALQSLY